MRLRSRVVIEKNSPGTPCKRKRVPRNKSLLQKAGKAVKDQIENLIKLGKGSSVENGEPKNKRNNPKLDTFKTPTKEEFNDKYRKSTLLAWRRAFAKYSPTKEAKMSPLKATQANLQRNVLTKEDLYIDVFIWVVNMSEQFYYDNSILLLNSAKSDKSLMVKMIRRNYKDVDLVFFNNLIDINFLGQGSFGSVYSATDNATSKKYAIKYISPSAKNMVKHCNGILDYMAERNSIIRAMNSPFVINFYYSLQVKSVGGVFLFFEYCIGDLSTYIRNIEYNDLRAISIRISKHDKEIIQDLDKDVDVLDVSLMYMFELFCGLDFLVKANIIHRDIKPENLMISEELHLKIGDFGIIYRTRTIHRESNRLLVKHNDINATESSNYDLDARGTSYYMDFESLLIELEDDEDSLFDEVLEDRDLFDTPKIRYDNHVLRPTFLVDTWAAGLVCTQLLFRGFHLFDPEMMSSSVLPDLPRKSHRVFAVHAVGRKSIYKDFVYNGLLFSGGRCHKELMEFIALIFRPRETRSTGFTKKKTLLKFTKTEDLKYIDMKKVENISSFKERHFTTTNIITFKVPNKIREFYKSNEKPRFSTFKQLINSFSEETSGKRLIEMQPGTTINYFH